MTVNINLLHSCESVWDIVMTTSFNILKVSWPVCSVTP